MDIFRKIADRKISEAISEGEFENLSGNGKPLVFDDETWIPEDLRIAFRYLKNAGYVPPELELRKEIKSLGDLINVLDNDEERMKKMKILNFKIAQLNMMRDRPLKLDDEFRTMEKLLDTKRISVL